ncbi:PLC-like phosphodiesterase [Parasitella parasitica]|nr:PLC-like phosphodiesterase [Parasitella parasitica]
MQRIPSIFFLWYYFWIHIVKAECNGGVELCNQSYDNITQLITHDSYALTPNIAATQDYDIINQLNDGVRGIKLSAVPSSHNPEIIHLCHTFCTILDAGLVSNTLDNISQWLENNPKEVVTIMWNNLYNFNATQLAAAYEASEVMPYVYLPNNSASSVWPTIQEMIDTNQRLVNFVDTKADILQVPWLMDQFSHIFETPYNNVDIGSFNCNVDRIAQELSPYGMMYVMNHFIYKIIEMGPLKIEIPFKEKAITTNAKESLIMHASNCSLIFQKKPSFVEVDFYTIGDALSVVSELNGVPAIPSNFKKSVPINGSSTIAFHKSDLLPTQHVLIENASSLLYFRRSFTINALSVILLFALM